MKTETLFSYKIAWKDFFKFEAFGQNALVIFYIVEVMANMQKNTGLYLPIKGKPEWVKVSNSLWPKDPASKSRTIKKLVEAKLLEVRKLKTEISNPVVKIIRPRRKSKIKVPLAGNPELEIGNKEKRNTKQGLGDFVYMEVK